MKAASVRTETARDGAVRTLVLDGPPGNIVAISTCHEFLAELDRYRGAADLWVVIAHMTPGVIGQRDDLLRYLDTIGTRRRTIAVPSRMMGGNRLPAEAFQYELKIRPEDMKYVTRIIREFSRSDLKNSYVEKWLEKNWVFNIKPHAEFRIDF